VDFKPYLKAFANTARVAQDTYDLTGDRLLVATLSQDQIAKEVKTKGGIIIPETDRQTNNKQVNLPTMAIVMLAGAGYYNDDTGEVVPLDTTPGDIILVGQNAIVSFSQFGALSTYGKNEIQIGICSESSIQMRWKGQEAYDQFFDTLVKGIRE
jgi:co-chaperonin GroES (HSP10)